MLAMDAGAESTSCAAETLPAQGNGAVEAFLNLERQNAKTQERVLACDFPDLFRYNAWHRAQNSDMAPCTDTVILRGADIMSSAAAQPGTLHSG